MTYNVFSGTLNPTQSIEFEPRARCLTWRKMQRWNDESQSKYHNRRQLITHGVKLRTDPTCVG